MIRGEISYISLLPFVQRDLLVTCRLLVQWFLCCSLSQNGFFTDKGELCADKCCCAITGWGSFTRGKREPVSEDISRLFSEMQQEVLAPSDTRAILLGVMFVLQEVLKQKSRQCTQGNVNKVAYAHSRLLGRLALTAAVIRELWPAAMRAPPHCHIRSTGILCSSPVVFYLA